MSEKKKILIVDDEQDMLTFISTLFQDNGYETITGKDGAEGYRLAKSEKPDLITLDMTMPEQSGIRTYRDLKGDPELQKIPVIIVTAIGENMKSFLESRRSTVEPEGFMTKPVDQEKLIEMVKDLLS